MGHAFRFVVRDELDDTEASCYLDRDQIFELGKNLVEWSCRHKRVESTMLYWNGEGQNPNKRLCHDCGKIWEPGE